jgi:toxin CcdB
MARYDVYRNSEIPGYLLDVQADLLSHLNTRVVVPLLFVSDSPIPAKTLNPVFEVEGQQVSMVTQFLAAVPSVLLKDKVGELNEHRDQITAALDLLLVGF